MAGSILAAFNNLALHHDNDLRAYSRQYRIRINSEGSALEMFVKDAFVNSFKLGDEEKQRAYRSLFSYFGNQNNPPDFMIKGGDAFEVKKVEKIPSKLALNSAPPKDRLRKSDPMITKYCRECEEWEEKDLYYVIGLVEEGTVRSLFYVHALCYAADKSVYEKVSQPLKHSVSQHIKELGLEEGDTVELGRIHRVDPLGITDFRIRGMWEIVSPHKVFEYVLDKINWLPPYSNKSIQFSLDGTKQDRLIVQSVIPEGTKWKNFTLLCLMLKTKYESYPLEDRRVLESNPLLKVIDTTVKDPNNPVKTLDVKFIMSRW